MALKKEQRRGNDNQAHGLVEDDRLQGGESKQPRPVPGGETPLPQTDQTSQGPNQGTRHKTWPARFLVFIVVSNSFRDNVAGQNKTILGHHRPRRLAPHVIGKALGKGTPGRSLGDDEALFQRCMEAVRNQGVAAFASQLRIDRQGQGEDADLGIAGLDELGRVGDVLAITSFGSTFSHSPAARRASSARLP
jgi:hypothetical protein